jgi:hypothetical protein
MQPLSSGNAPTSVTIAGGAAAAAAAAAAAGNGIGQDSSPSPSPDEGGAHRQAMPASFRDDTFVSDEMQHLLSLDCPEEMTPVGLNNISYANSIFPEWLSSTAEWQKAKFNSNKNGNNISEIIQTPHAQRSHDQVSIAVKWLMGVWKMAGSMGFAKCAAMFKEFKYFKHEPGENIITEGETGRIVSRALWVVGINFGRW